jgi:hypothetical protein
MVVFDASVLLLLLDPDASPPKDRATGQAVEQAKARIEHLIATLERQRTKVIIPTPVLSEVLVRAGDAAPAYLEELNRSARSELLLSTCARLKRLPPSTPTTMMCNVLASVLRSKSLA